MPDESMSDMANGLHISHSDASLDELPPRSGSGPTSRPQSPSFFYPPYKTLNEKILGRIATRDKFFSLEFFPPRTVNGAVNLISRFERMASGQPLFVDITWHPSGDPAGDKETSSMAIAAAAANYCGLDTLLHFCCSGLNHTQAKHHLDRARDLGIRNILALRGDPVGEMWQKQESFNYASDLVSFLRQNYGNFFSVGVAGYPSNHPESPTTDTDIHFQKVKCDAGADFIISQLFFGAETYLEYLRDCREAGINIPIIPGIMPIQGYQSLRHIIKLSKLEVPQEIVDTITPIKDNDEAIRNYGIHVCVEMCRRLLACDDVPGLHFFTLNKETATTTILKQLGLWCESPVRPLPWKVTANHHRCSEEVRPIFWSTRPNSYVYRTSEWDEYPNGRWGNSSAPSFGEISDYYLFYLKPKAERDQLRAMWGRELGGEEDVWHVFHCYLLARRNKWGSVVRQVPWNDDELQAETVSMVPQLAAINLRGILTINSQPNVNGAKSTDPVFGWGPPGGYIYQKAYLEFFTSRGKCEALKEILQKYPHVNYHFIDQTGEEDVTNCHHHEAMAVTWGVFPGKEIIQPTVVDPVSFRFWKDEAFALWHEQWGKLYEENSRSRQVIDEICREYCLVSLVDNNYPDKNCLWDIMDELLNTGEMQTMNDC